MKAEVLPAGSSLSLSHASKCHETQSFNSSHPVLQRHNVKMLRSRPRHGYTHTAGAERLERNASIKTFPMREPNTFAVVWNVID